MFRDRRRVEAESPRDPLLTVIMPVYNGGDFLAPAIESVLDQEEVEFEFLIVDDGSTDGSADVVRSFAERDPRIRHMVQARAGYSVGLNRGLAAARGRLLARMDADDLCMPGRFLAQARELLARPGLAVVGGHVETLDAQGRRGPFVPVPVGPRRVARQLDEWSPIVHPAAMIRVEALRELGGYRPQFEPAEDYDLWLRAVDAGYEIDNLDRQVLRYRVHAGSVSETRRSQQAVKTRIALAASRMRRAGLGDPVQPGDLLDHRWFDRIPSRFRPCPTELWEDLHGPPGSACLDALIEECRSLEARNGGERGCRHQSAEFLIRSAVRFARERRWDQALRARRLALALSVPTCCMYPFRTAARQFIRGLRRLRGRVIATRTGG